MKRSGERAPFRKTLFWLVVILQVLVVVAIIGWRVSLVRSGTPVLLKCAPVDPRSLFSGDYVVLRYDISSVPARLFDEQYSSGEVIYLALVQERNGPYWEVARVSNRRRVLSDAYDVVIRGRPGPVDDMVSIPVDFGIENYFVPQNEGRKIEDSLRQAEVHAEVAVTRSGHAALKRLFVDGEDVTFY